jgi:hypothetical protein
MYYLLKFILLCLVSEVAWGNDISALTLIAPIPYNKESRFSQYAVSKIGVSTIGRLINVDDEIRKQITPFNNDLAKYFPKTNELNKLVDDVLIDINANIVKGKITDDKVTAVYSYVGKNLIAKMADRILETEGVKDQQRRNAWVLKILEPFNSCIATSLDSQFDAKHCMSALTAGLVPNIGMAIVHELSKTNLSSSLPEAEQATFNLSQVTTYQTCLGDFLPKATPKNVNSCALIAMKKGVESITEKKLASTLKSSSSSPEASDKIKENVWAPFDGCVKNVGSNTPNPIPLAQQFSSCIDQLVVQTGTQIVSDKVEHTPALRLAFSAAEVKNLSSEKALQFKKCSENLVKKDIRKNGVIDTSTCENAITNDLVYQTVLKKFNQSALDQVKGTSIDPGLLQDEGKKILDNCWKQNQAATQREACLRKSTIEFSIKVAERRLDFSVPKEIASRKKIQKDALANFRTCLEKRVPLNISEEEHLTEKMDPCTSTLLRSATNTVVEESIDTALNENLGNKKDLDLSADRAKLKTQILANFKECLIGKTDLAPCTDQVTKEATLTIALAAGRVSRGQQLPKSPTPSSDYLAIENKLKTCTTTILTGVELSKHLDDCKKSFVIEMARTIGIEKFNTTLKDLLGTKKYEESLPHTVTMLQKYNKCLDDLYKDYKDVSICTDQLGRDGELVFKDNVNQWMSSEEKDAATEAIKAQFVDFLPCLSGLLPAGGKSPAAKVEKDVAPLMEVIAKLIAQYIEYSPENAKQDIEELIAQFAKDMHDSTDSAVARKNIVDLLYKNGAFDQFLKSYVRKIVGDSFAKIPDSFLPKALKDSLISKENFDAIFNSTEGKKIKEAVLNQLINPIIVDGKSGSSPEAVASTADITNQVTRLLINSPYFGEKIIASQVQGSLDNMNALKGLFVKIVYGSNALDWQKVRMTPEGQIAENYIKENIMTPKFKMITVTAEDTKKYNDEAERLVSMAVKKYKEPKK